MSGLRLWLAAIALAGATPCAAQSHAAEPGAGTLTAAAHSALVSLEARTTSAGVTLWLRRTADRQPLPATELSVSVEGRSEPATVRPDGSWFVSLARAAVAGERIEVTVAHDGIREVLSARFVAPGAGDAGGGSATARTPGAGASGASPPGAGGGAARVWRDHKQMAWWILNIVVVLIAAIAISRRMS